MSHHQAFTQFQKKGRGSIGDIIVIVDAAICCAVNLNLHVSISICGSADVLVLPRQYPLR